MQLLIHILSSGRGYTLIEIVSVIGLIGILAAIAIPNMMDLRTDAKSAITKDEMASIKRGIVGDGRVVAGGSYAFAGYEADMGAPPGGIDSMVTNPNTADTVQDYDPIKRSGWRGPYIDASTTSDFSRDAWGTAYVFTTSPRLIRSWGPNKSNNNGTSDDIDLTF